jgi:hypothetical protein
LTEQADGIARICAALLVAAVVWLPAADTVFQPLTARAISPIFVLVGTALVLRAASRLEYVGGFDSEETWIRFLARLMDGPVPSKRPRTAAISQGLGGCLLIAVGLLALVT